MANRWLLRAGLSVLGLSCVGATLIMATGRSADGYTPPQAGLPLPVYATPALLAVAPVTGLSVGSTAWVTNQGGWSYQAACPRSCDGANTCRAAGAGDGGFGCWLRGTAGIAGAQNVAAWYIDCSTGSDTNDGLTPSTALATIDEWLLRVGPQCLPANAVPIVTIETDCETAFASRSYTFNLCANGGETPSYVGYPVVFAPRIYAGADGGPLGLFTLQTYTPWAGSAKQEGVAYFVPTVDGGPAFDPATMGPAQGYGLEEIATGNSLYCGDKIDGGTCNTAGTYALNSFVQSEPTQGNAFRMFKLVQIGTDSSSITINGTTAPDFQNIQIGATTHAIQVQTSPTIGFTSAYFESCIVNGPDVAAASSIGTGGNAFMIGHVHVYGIWSSYGADLLYGSALESRQSGFIDIYGNMIAGGNTPVESGCSETGGGFIEIDGNFAITQYADYGIHVCQAGNVYNNGYWWLKNSVSNATGYYVQSGGLITYSAGHAPGLTGVVPSAAYSIGGAQYDAGATPPLVNTASFAGVVVNQ